MITLSQMNILTQEDFVFGNLSMSKGVIFAIEKLGGERRGAPYLLPGLFDVHTHGGWGYDFNSANAQQLDLLLDNYYLGGVTSLLATIMTEKKDVTHAQLRLLAKAAKKHANLKGMHLEGPFLSGEYCGAQPKKFLCKPDVELFEDFQQSAEGLIKLVTIAPELEGACEFIEYLTSKNVKVSLGHSGASALQTQSAVQKGAVSFTHLLNGMPDFDKRQPNIVNFAFAHPQFSEVIADGKHLHPDTVKFLTRLIECDKIIGITDSIAPAFLPYGNYSLPHYAVTTTQEGAFMDNGKRAGSVLSAFEAVCNMRDFCNITLEKAIRFFTVNPCTMLGMNTFGKLEKNKDADVLIVKDDKILSVYTKGRQVV